MDIDVIVERKSFDVELEVGNPVVEVKAPDHYNGPFDIFPSDEDQIIPVKEKMPVEDICVKAIKMEPVTITENGDYFPPPSQDGFSEVIVDIPMGEWSPNPYEGNTVITPSDERQTLPTRGKYLSNNVVINPIPSNYGKISWNGSVLTVL